MDLEKFLAKLIFLGIHKEQPGFIILSYDFKKVKIFERDIVLPEDFIVELEKLSTSVKEAYELYKIGKTFMWNYLSLVNVKPVSNWNDIERYCKDFARYFRISVASDLKYRLIKDPPLLELYFRDWVVCRKNGLGFINTGLAAGLGFAAGKKEIEAAHLKCQGRGDEMCVVVIGLPENIVKVYPSARIWKCPDIKEYKIGDISYKIFNKPRAISNPYSFSHFKKKNLTCFGMRYFYVETTLLHLLEQNINGKIIFEVAKIIGSKIASNMNAEYPQEICNFVSALGFGEINYHKVGGKRIVKVYHYPYSRLIRNYDFPYLRGILSGALTQLTGEEVNFKVKKYAVTDTFSLFLEA